MPKYEICTITNSEDRASLEFLDCRKAEETMSFHASFPQYHATPLHRLKNLATYYGVKEILVKDESFRFGLNAFKVLGGSFAVVNYLSKVLNRPVSELTFDVLTSKEVREQIKDIVFVTATDGNHGRGLAWTANQLGLTSYVYMPKGSTTERLENIRKENSHAEILEKNYDECVRFANMQAEKYGWVMVQDTAWDGYEEIPTWIMQGYLTMAMETYYQLKLLNLKPTHIFLQAGVGSMASAMTGFFSSVYPGNEKPDITIVEPDRAACLFNTAKYGKDGELVFVTGDMDTIMAGLACGEPCTIGWNVISSYANHFLSVPDHAAAHGMRILGNPLKGDTRVISGESGAVTTGVVSQLLHREDLKAVKEEIGLNENSVILCISTEGNTDALRYRELVWNGMYSNKY